MTGVSSSVHLCAFLHFEKKLLCVKVRCLQSAQWSHFSCNSNLYWADWNRDAPKIETSYMDGSNRRVLVKDDLGLPNGLTYDSQSSLLCWADAGGVHRRLVTQWWYNVFLVIDSKWSLSPAGTHKMECMHPARGDRRKVTEGIQYPFGMASFGKNVYYTDWRRLDLFFECELVCYNQRTKKATTKRVTARNPCLFLSNDVSYLSILVKYFVKSLFGVWCPLGLSQFYIFTFNTILIFQQ